MSVNWRLKDKVTIAQEEKIYLTYGMVLCLVTLTDISVSRGFVSINWASCFILYQWAYYGS